MDNGDVTDAEQTAPECYIDGCTAPVFEANRTGLRQYYVCGHGHRFATASAGDDHRLADAEPAEQPGPTDDDGDGIVWRDDGETCPACGGDLEGGACATCGFEP
jgi:hypothetical protein